MKQKRNEEGALTAPQDFEGSSHVSTIRTSRGGRRIRRRSNCKRYGKGKIKKKRRLECMIVTKDELCVAILKV